MGLDKTLNRIGERITGCRKKCKGIENDPRGGIYPRCFYPEVHRKKGYFDYIVIGINPGTASDLERAFVKYIKSHKPNFKFEDVKTVMKPAIESHDYYKRVRAFLELYPNNRKKNINILWTELVKCQNQLDKNKKKLPLNPTTEEECFKRFLKKEIEIFSNYDKKPLLVLLGDKVSNFIIRYIKKSKKGKKEFGPFCCLKLYHPTGSRIFNSYYFRGKNIENRLLKRGFPSKKNFLDLI